MLLGFIFEPGLQLSPAVAAAVQVCVYSAAAAAAAAQTRISVRGCGSDLSRRPGYAMNHKGEHRNVLFSHLCSPVHSPVKLGLLLPNFEFSSENTKVASL